MKPKTSKSKQSAPATAGETRRRLLVVDDHPFMRAGLAQLIDRQPDLVVSAEAGNPAEGLQRVQEGQLDLVLTDITMPGRSGAEFIKDLHAIRPDLPVLVISMHDEAIYAERMLRAGARGYIMKEAGGGALLAAVRQVLRGEVSVSAKLSARLLENLTGGRPRGSSSPIARLSDREFEVFQMIGQGKGTGDIAAELHLSPKTVDVHRANIKVKLGLKGSTALVRHAVRWLETQGAGM